MNKYCLIILALSVLSVISLKAQVFYNEGTLFVGGSSTATALYVDGDMVVAGDECRIIQTGTTVLTGDFVNDVTTNNVFTASTGTFKFISSDAQYIYGSANKASSYIHFPENVVIDNSNTAHNGDSAAVVLDAGMGATMKNLTLTKGRLEIDSKVNGTNTDIAHLLIEEGGVISYNHSTASKANAGIVQVNLAMGNNADVGGLVGFSSPFKSIYSDYFFYNFLAIPKSDLFFSGNRDLWELTPNLKMEAGKGYVIGQGLVPHTSPHNQPGGYYDTQRNSSDYPNALYADVAKERFSFARLFAPSSFTQYATATDRFTGEELNTGEVLATLIEGFNYLGNPYTVPLNMESFLNNPTLSDWGSLSADVEARFYILSPGSTGSYNSTSGLFSFTASHLVGQIVGSTTDHTLAPMQMFAVKKTSSGTTTFRFNPNARTHGEQSFLRSYTEPIDELLIETKDLTTGGFDRICVVFRPDATLKGDDTYDAEKLFNTTGGVNQVYTRSEDDIDLTTNVVPSRTQRLDMYFMPSATNQHVELTADRLSSLQSVQTLILEDTQTGSYTDLLHNPTYTFTSSPTDKIARFVLHFNANPMTSNESVAGKSPLSASYRSGTIDVKGLEEADLGHTISVFSAQGVLLSQHRITDITNCVINRSLATGVYFVKVDNHTKAIKLFAKD